MGGGPNGDRGISITVDIYESVYTTGYFQGTGDFDPGSGIYNLTTTPAGSDIFVVKLGPGSSCTAVSISTQPSNQTATVGSTATFSVVAGGTSPYTYQWRKNGVDISGANSDSYTTPTLTLSDNGNTYRCYVTNCSGSYSVASNDAILTVNSICTTPTTQASNISFSSIGANQLTTNWTRGNGTAGVIVVARLTTTLNVDPSSGTSYTANGTFGSGSTTGAGNYVVYKGTGTSIIVAGLTCNTGYTFTVYEYNTTGTCYKIPGLSSAVTTAACACTQPTTQATIGVYTNNTSGTSVTTNWTRGNGTAGVIVVARLTTNANVDPSSGTSYTANAVFGSGSTTGAGNYVVYNGTGTSVNVTGLTCNTGYTFTVYEYNTTGTCYMIPGLSSAVISAACVSTATISITSSQIPPWQRENDNLAGSISATYSNMQIGANIQLDIYVNGIYAGTPASTTWATTSSSGIHQFDFNILASSLNPKPKKGDQVGYQLITNVSSAHDDATQYTSIIESKWDKTTQVYYNIVTQKLNIPLSYYQNTTSVTIAFTRDYNTCYPGDLSLKIPLIEIVSDNIINGSLLQNGNKTYCDLSYFNSNIETVFPGEFSYSISYSGTNITESGKFSLVKIGRIGQPWNPSNNKVLVIIGGIFNTTEKSIKDLTYNSFEETSSESFSIGSYFSKNYLYNTWYIAQGNINRVNRNAYDIGVALEKIRELTTADEISLICHSKGGLDTRALIQNLSLSLENTNKTYTSFSVNGIIKKIVFLGTPHLGSDKVHLLRSLIYKSIRYLGLDLAGVTDLFSGGVKTPSHILYKLKNTSLPSSIQYLNLAAYKITKVQTFFPFYFNSYLNEFHDGWTPVESNDDLYISTKSSFIKQLYQENSEETPHFEIHKNKALSTVTNSTYGDRNCIYPYSSNLKKIKVFITGNSQTYNSTIPFSSCSRPQISSVSVNTVASILSGAFVSLKMTGNATFNLLGITGENGEFNAIIIPALEIGDSIKIEAADCETLVLAIDSGILKNGKIDVSMLKSSTPTTKIKYPQLKLVNQNPITNIRTINIEATGQNVISYSINSPFNQDTTFIPLNLSNNQFIAQLDTGYNQILVRFIGQQDTVTIGKEVYYFPDSLMSQNTYKVSISANTSSLGAKVYVNNQFVKQINSLIDSIPVLNGQSTFKFTKFGYVDSLLTVDSIASINLSLELIPYSYSSITDSNIVNFPLQGKLQYRRNVTMLDSAQASVISIKQFDDNFPGKGLIPKSRKFEFRHLNAPTWSNIKTAIVLDQIANLSLDSIYLMKISNDTSFAKILFDPTGTIAGYDSLVQKLSYNYINFGSGTATKEALVIMKKQAPIVRSVPTLNVNENDSLTIPLSQLFSDPDSIHNDMTFQIPNPNPTGLHLSISNGNVLVKTNSCYSGNTSLSVQATHDGLVVSNAINITVTATTQQPVITSNGSTIFCQGGSVILTSNAASGNQWYKDGVAINGSTGTTINVNVTGTYTVKVTVNSCGSVSSNAIAVTVNSIPTQPGTITGANTICQSSSQTYSVTAVPAATSYTWTLPSGWIGTSTTNSITAIVGTSGGTISVVANNICGSSGNQTLNVTINPVPSLTLIRDTILLSSIASNYRWFFNNNTLNGETSNSIRVKKTGFYRVETSPDKICWAPSIDFPILVLPDRLVNDTLSMDIYPNPTPDNFNVVVRLQKVTNIIAYVTVTNVSGNVVLQTDKLILFSNEVKIPVNLNMKGSFFVKVYINGDVKTMGVIIQ